MEIHKKKEKTKIILIILCFFFVSSILTDPTDGKYFYRSNDNNDPKANHFDIRSDKIKGFSQPIRANFTSKGISIIIVDHPGDSIEKNKKLQALESDINKHFYRKLQSNADLQKFKDNYLNPRIIDGRILNAKIISDAKPGGVLLGFAAKGLEQTGNIKLFQILDNGILLIGEKEENIIEVSLNIDWMKTAIYSLYYNKQNIINKPGVTIDPPEDFQETINTLSNTKNSIFEDNISNINKLFSSQDVKFFGGIENTDYGYILFEADRLLKCLSAGRDNIDNKIQYTSKNVKINGFKNILELRALSTNINANSSTRFWFTPEFEIHEENNRYFIKGNIRVNTENKLFGKTISDPYAEQFAEFFNNNYDLFSEQFPVFKKLKQIGELTSIIQLLKNKNIVPEIYKNEKATEKITPTSTPTIFNRIINKTQYFIQKYAVFGGVDFHKKPKILNGLDDDKNNIITDALFKGFDLDFDNYSWTFDSNGETYVATYLPLNENYKISIGEKKKEKIKHDSKYNKILSPNKCAICGREFTFVAKFGRVCLFQHAKVCEYCGEFYFSANQLTHVCPIKKVKCKICGEEYTTSANPLLNTFHMHLMKKAKCKICGEEYYYQAYYSFSDDLAPWQHGCELKLLEEK